MTQSIRAIAGAFALLIAVASLTACNTTAGAGQDISSAGKAIERSADRNK